MYIRIAVGENPHSNQTACEARGSGGVETKEVPLRPVTWSANNPLSGPPRDVKLR